MLKFDHDTLVMVLSEHSGVELVSLGKARDGFVLEKDVPHWTSGFGGKYEMTHTNVPAGAMIAAGDLEGLSVGDFDALKEQLKKIDIYPTGHSGDFTGKPVEELREWFFDRSVRNDEANHQWPIIHTAHQLTPEKLDNINGKGTYQKLVDYLADEMNLFKVANEEGKRIPEEREARVAIVESLLSGLSQTVRYTRKDDPALGYQLKSAVDIVKKDAGTISLHLEDVYKILVVRTDPKSGKTSITPLDKGMLDKSTSYTTKDGQPIGDRGSVDIIDIVNRAAEIEQEKAGKEVGGNTIQSILKDGPGGRPGATPGK